MHELMTWLRDATPDQIAARIAVAERDAFLWHVAVTTSGEAGEGLRAACEQTAGLLREGGYAWPPVGTTPL